MRAAVGVAPEVIAGYVLLYSANGLFQHSNVHLRYGWLNYLVGSAETHRWHHARDPFMGACNYGTTTVIWDVVFGTWRLPRRQHLEEVGMMDARYPADFWGQVVIPFHGWSLPQLRHAIAQRFANFLIRIHLWLTLLGQGWRIARTTRNPMHAQRALLARIVRDNPNPAQRSDSH